MLSIATAPRDLDGMMGLNKSQRFRLARAMKLFNSDDGQALAFINAEPEIQSQTLVKALAEIDGKGAVDMHQPTPQPAVPQAQPPTMGQPQPLVGGMQGMQVPQPAAQPPQTQMPQMQMPQAHVPQAHVPAQPALSMPSMPQMQVPQASPPAVQIPEAEKPIQSRQPSLPARVPSSAQPSSTNSDEDMQRLKQVLEAIGGVTRENANRMDEMMDLIQTNTRLVHTLLAFVLAWADSEGGAEVVVQCITGNAAMTPADLLAQLKEASEGK